MFARMYTFFPGHIFSSQIEKRTTERESSKEKTRETAVFFYKEDELIPYMQMCFGQFANYDVTDKYRVFAVACVCMLNATQVCE